jgi:hypothetical protein
MRTSMIVDPAMAHSQVTAEAQRSLLPNGISSCLVAPTDTCKNGCRLVEGGNTIRCLSPRRTQPPPGVTSGLVAAGHQSPRWSEDSSLWGSLSAGGLLRFASISFRRIVQTPGGITIFSDVGQGQGWQRNIVMNGAPICRPTFASGMTCVATGREIPSSST